MNVADSAPPVQIAREASYGGAAPQNIRVAKGASPLHPTSALPAADVQAAATRELTGRNVAPGQLQGSPMEQGEALAPELRVRYTPPRPSRQSTGLQVRWSCGGARRAVGNAWSAPGAKAIYAAVALMVVGAGVTAVGAYFLVKKKESPASPAAGVAVGVGGGAFVVGLWVLAIGCRDHVNQARTALRASDRQAPLALASYPQRPAPSRTPDQLFIQFP